MGIFGRDASGSDQTWIEASQNFGFPEATTVLGHKNIVKIIFRHRKRKYASVGAKSLIT